MLTFFSLAIIANAVILMEPYVFGQLLEILQEGGEDLWPRSLRYLIMLAVIPLIFWMFFGVSRIFERKVSFYVMGNYREAMLAALFDLPVEWHRTNHSGKNIDKMSRAAMAILHFTEEMFVITEIVVRLLGSFILLFFIQAYVGIVAALVALLSFTLVVIFDIFLFRQMKQLHSMYNKTASAIHDYVSNVFTVLTMRFSSSAVAESMRRHYVPFPLFVKNAILNECKWASVTFFITIMTIGVIAWEVFGAVNSGEVILIGYLYTLYAYLDKIGNNFYQFAWKYSQIVEQDASVASAENIFKSYARLGEKVNAKAPKDWREIRMEKLHFTYQDEEKVEHQIEDIALTIPRGAKIAFVGESGCGKSTVLGLLRGIYEASDGDVFADGKKLKYGVAHLSDMTTLMPQEPEIFENTIRYNVAMGVSVSDKKLMEILKLARFDGVLKKLPNGLDTNIAEKGVNLSGGEKQRLALARGLLAGESSDILLMDEPTSSVDMKNERAILEEVFRRNRGKTIIASVHRLSLLPMFDIICHFEDGRIARVEKS